jgi:hypothetical protein
MAGGPTVDCFCIEFRFVGTSVWRGVNWLLSRDEVGWIEEEKSSETAVDRLENAGIICLPFNRKAG